MYLVSSYVCCMVILVVFSRGISGMNETASPEESVTLECLSNQNSSLINWYRNNIHLASTERYSSDVPCGVINIVKYIKFTVGRCDQNVHQLIINNVSYTEDNGAHWSCNDSSTTNRLILSIVEPTSTTETTEPRANHSDAAGRELNNMKEDEPQTIVIIAASSGAAVCVIGVVLVISIFVYKHRKMSTATKEHDLHVSADTGVDGADNVTGNKSQRQTKFPEYAKVSETNKPDQPNTEPIIMENDLYTSADHPTKEPIIMENDIYTSADQSSTEPIIVENDLYTSADQPTTELIIMENDIYSSADQCQADCVGIDLDQTGNAHFNSPVTKPGDTDGPVYSLVNKTKKPVPTPDNTDGPVYSIVNKHNNQVPIPGDKDGPVYSIVNKHKN